MADSAKTRIDIGFSGGQTLALKVADDEFSKLRSGIDKGDAWQTIQADDAEFSVNLSEIVYLRKEAAEQRVGF